MRAFADADGRRAVLVGSCAEYDWSSLSEPDSRCREEGPPLAPATLYGKAKHATHLVAAAYAAARGIELAWGRVFFLFGAGEAPGRLVPSIAHALLRGEVAPMTSGTQVRDFLPVDDVAGAVVALLESAVTGPVNIASGEGVAVHELARLVAEAVGAPELLRVGALPQRSGEPAVIVADARRLREGVGYRPATSLADAVARTVAALRDADPVPP